MFIKYYFFKTVIFEQFRRHNFRSISLADGCSCLAQPHGIGQVTARDAGCYFNFKEIRFTAYDELRIVYVFDRDSITVSVPDVGLVRGCDH